MRGSVVGEDEGAEEGIEAPGDERAYQGGAHSPSGCLQHGAELQVAQGSAQQLMADDGARDKAHAVCRAQQHHHQASLGCDERRRESQGQLGDGDAGDDEGGGPDFLAGVEHAQVQQHQCVGDQGEGRETNGPAQHVGGVQTVVSVREERRGNKRAEAGEEHNDRDQRHHGELGGHGEITHHGLVIAIGGIAGKARHHCGQQGHANHAIRHLQQLPCLLVDQRGGVAGVGRDAVIQRETDLGNGHVNDDGHGHATEALQAVINAPQRAQVNPGLAQVRHHDQSLHHHAQGGTQAQEHDMRIGDGDVLKWLQLGAVRQQQIEGQDSQSHHVVGHGCPRAGLEDLLGVQNGHEHREHGIEEDLRQDQIAKSRGHLHVHLALGIQHHAGEYWREQDR